MGQLDRDRQVGCELCNHEGGLLIGRTALLRVIRVADPDYPGFYRVVWNRHVSEFTGLSIPERVHCMEAVAMVETLMLDRLHPTKINLASLGNMVSHLHWHVIARFRDDKHFPQPIWGMAQREASHKDADMPALIAGLDQAIHQALGNLTPP